MATGFGAGGGFAGGGVELAGGEEEFPAGGVELTGGGSEELWPGPVELPPQPVSAMAIIAIGNSRVVVVLPTFIALAPLRRRIAAVTDGGNA